MEHAHAFEPIQDGRIYIDGDAGSGDGAGEGEGCCQGRSGPEMGTVTHPKHSNMSFRDYSQGSWK
jgi:hypothetical protein